jgi:hypothetical protein
VTQQRVAVLGGHPHVMFRLVRSCRRERALVLDMWVIFMDIPAGQGGLSSVEMEARRGCCRSVLDPVC